MQINWMRTFSSIQPRSFCWAHRQERNLGSISFVYMRVSQKCMTHKITFYKISRTACDFKFSQIQKQQEIMTDINWRQGTEQMSKHKQCSDKLEYIQLICRGVGVKSEFYVLTGSLHSTEISNLQCHLSSVIIPLHDIILKTITWHRCQSSVQFQRKLFHVTW